MDWHWIGLLVVPWIVIDGTTVVPLMVAMQVFWQLNCWLLQPLRQVAEDELGVTGVVIAGAVVSCVPAVGGTVAAFWASPAAGPTQRAIPSTISKVALRVAPMASSIASRA